MAQNRFMHSVVWIIAVLVFGMGTTACAADLGGSKDCKITNEEAAEMFKKLAGRDAKVQGVEPSPVKGLVEVFIEVGGQSGVLYFDCSKKYLVQGAIIEIDTKKNKTAERMQEIQDKKRVDVSGIPLDKAIVMGDPKAPKKIIVFTDPDCPFCSKLHEELKKVLEKRKDIVIYLKMFPLPMHKDAYWKSKSIICANSLKMLEDVFNKKTIEKKECDTKEVDDTIKKAEELGITGTPALILPDGRLRSGAIPADDIIALIDGKK